MSVLTRFVSAWRAFRTPEGPPEEPQLELQRELAGLRLELAEREKELQRLRRQLETQAQSQAEQVGESLQARLKALFEGLAAPLAQLHMQDSLLSKGKPVAVQDIMALARQAALAARRSGLEPLGEIGANLAFDPALMQPLSGAAIAPGEEVTVKIIGYRFRGEVIRKAFVERKK